MNDGRRHLAAPALHFMLDCIRVAEYLTELPPREVLEQKLKSCGGDCTRAAGGAKNEVSVCRRVCREGVIHGVPGRTDRCLIRAGYS